MIKQRSKIIFLVSITSVLVLGFLAKNNVSTLVSYWSYSVLYVHRKITEPLVTWLREKQTVYELHAQIALLERKNEMLLGHAIRLRSQIAYLDQTKELIAFSRRFNQEGVLAQVLARSFEDNDHYFFIEGGSDVGIEKDMIVTYKSQLLGKIAAVYPWYSKVCLITDHRCKIAAFCPENKARGIHEGTFDKLSTSLTYVSHLSQVKEGDLVLSSGEGLIFPQGYALGRIESATKDDLYQKITVKPVYRLEQIEYCLVHKRELNPVSVSI